MVSSNGESDAPSQDPVWKRSLREAIWILAIAGAFMAWTVCYCYSFGYGEEAKTDLTLGIPTWVFWGIAIPWAVAVLVSVCVAVWLIEDDSLANASSSQNEETLE